MITFEQTNVEERVGQIVCRIDESLATHKPPFTFRVTNDTSKAVLWETNDMQPGWFSTYYSPTHCTATITDADGNIVDTWRWETDQHGDEIHRTFLNWCRTNRGAKGIAIGTHDGTVGEWVVPAQLGLIDAFLVEASDAQYLELFRNYRDLDNCRTFSSLISTDGGEIEFYESDFTHTNSVSLDHVAKFSQNFRSVKKNSVSLNSLISLCGLERDLRWLHIDAEGIDDVLIMSLDTQNITLPEIIVYETVNLSQDRKSTLNAWLEERGYECTDCGWNGVAMLNKQK